MLSLLVAGQPAVSYPVAYGTQTAYAVLQTREHVRAPHMHYV